MSDVSLKEYVESQIKWLTEYHDSQVKWVDKHFELHVQSIQRATILALEQLNDRLARMNEFRDTLKDQTATFATRTEMDLRLRNLEISKAALDAKLLLIAALVSLVGSVAAATVVAFILQHLKIA